MKKAYLLYSIVACALALLCIGLVRLSRLTPVDGALRKLGRADREYAEARESILMSTDDPVPQLLKYVTAQRRSRRERILGLRVLAEVAQHQQSHAGSGSLAALLADTSQTVKLQVLETIAGFESMDCADAVARLFSTTTDSALFVQSLRTLRSCVAPLERRQSEAIKNGDTAAVDSCVLVVSRLPAARVDIVGHAAGFYAQRGDSLRAKTLRHTLGFVHDFWSTGPFLMNRTNEYFREFGPETKPFNPADQFDGPNRQKIGWTRLHEDDPTGFVYLSRPYPQPPRCVAYFMTYVNSPVPQDALLFFSSWEGMRAWCNGKPLFTDKKLDSARPDFDAARVTLNAGSNEVIFRIDRYMSEWGMSMRVTGADGTARDDIVCALEPAAR
jgi:hypothetical protein